MAAALYDFDPPPAFPNSAFDDNDPHTIPREDRLSIYDYLLSASRPNLGRTALLSAAEAANSSYSIPEEPRPSTYEGMTIAALKPGNLPATQGVGPSRQTLAMGRFPPSARSAEPPGYRSSSLLRLPTARQMQQNAAHNAYRPATTDRAASDPRKDPTNTMPDWVRQLRVCQSLIEAPIISVKPMKVLGALAITRHQRVEVRISDRGTITRTTMPADIFPLFIEDTQRASPKAVLLNFRVEEPVALH